MDQPRYRFGDFLLDARNRRLQRGGELVALNARYFDALALLVREHGQLVSKQRFFDEVWAGSVVSDAALTQCIKDIRRQLGDDASAPSFVRTVPGHGYCFIATVRPEGEVAEMREMDGIAEVPEPEPVPAPFVPKPALAAPPGLWADAAAAAAGGALAGLLGGLLYGSVLALSPQGQGLGTLSVLLVMVALSVAVGVAGAGCVGLGLAAGGRYGGSALWMLAGAATGGWLVGGLTRLLGSDAFTLLVGQAPAGTTGGLEGAVIGFAVAAGLLLGGGLDEKPTAPRSLRPAVFAALSTAVAGALLTLAGGSLMASSLARFASTFSGSRLDMAPLGRLFGEAQLGAWAQAGLGALEGGMFGGCMAAALLLARRGREGGNSVERLAASA